MSNLVELLRAICFDKEDMSNTKLDGLEFSDIEIEFMVLFKKVHEFGMTALENFIDKLNEEGHKLPEYSVIYYVDQLLNGCFSPQVSILAKGKRYFCKLSDSLFTLANVSSVNSNVSNISKARLPLGTTVDIFNKSPNFMQKNLINSVNSVEEMFRSGLYSSILIDNTLPLMDKKTSARCSADPTGELVKYSNGNYLVTDTNNYTIIKDLNSIIVDNVKNYLELYTETAGIYDSPPEFENFRIVKYKKEYRPFSTEDNTSATNISPVVKTFIKNDKKVELLLDIMGEALSYDEKIKIGSKEYNLRTNNGQLGS